MYPMHSSSEWPVNMYPVSSHGLGIREELRLKILKWMKHIYQEHLKKASVLRNYYSSYTGMVGGRIGGCPRLAHPHAFHAYAKRVFSQMPWYDTLGFCPTNRNTYLHHCTSRRAEALGKSWLYCPGICTGRSSLCLGFLDSVTTQLLVLVLKTSATSLIGTLRSHF